MAVDFSNLDILFAQTNLAEGIDKEELEKISEEVISLGKNGKSNMMSG
jgi:hypothetical protein